MGKKAVVYLAFAFLVVLASCASGTQNLGLDQEDGSKDTLANGMPFGDVHELHEGPDENGDRYAECLDCHKAHGMIFDWLDVDREYCLACHTDMTNHHRNQDCMFCHNTSGGPGNK